MSGSSRVTKKSITSTLLCGLVAILLHCRASALTPPDNGRPATSDNDSSIFSRRDILWKAPVGILATYGYGRLVYNALSVCGIQYPKEHEERVASTVASSLVAALPPEGRSVERVLEVGIGSESRLIRRGLYDKAFNQLSRKGIKTVELTGVDPYLPKKQALKDTWQRLDKIGQDDNLEIDLKLVDASITSRLPFPDGYFDAIVCCLTLCSVPDQRSALLEMKRLLRPNGGSLAYLEHVAVNEDEPYRFLEFQQTLLDPLQQRLADNCHLHRYTDDAILSAFEIAYNAEKGAVRAVRLQHERFILNSMWPVSCQSCGVIQRIA